MWLLNSSGWQFKRRLLSHRRAECARAHDAVLVTHSTREFVRIAGLRLVDWEET